MFEFSPRSWGRSQKYHKRRRYLYALIFDNGCIYIGQTVNPKNREKQHLSVKGGWLNESFTYHLLNSVDGTQAQTEDYEHAWRLVANARGRRVYGLPPNIVINPRKQATFKRSLLSWVLNYSYQASIFGIAWMRWISFTFLFIVCFFIIQSNFN